MSGRPKEARSCLFRTRNSSPDPRSGSRSEGSTGPGCLPPDGRAKTREIGKLGHVTPTKIAVGIAQTDHGTPVRTLDDPAGVGDGTLGARCGSGRVGRRRACQPPARLARIRALAVQEQPVDGLSRSGVALRHARLAHEHRKRPVCRTGSRRTAGGISRHGGIIVVQPRPGCPGGGLRIRSDSMRIRPFGISPTRAGGTRPTGSGLRRLGPVTWVIWRNGRGGRSRGPWRGHLDIGRGRTAPGQQDSRQPDRHDRTDHASDTGRGISAYTPASYMSSRHTVQLSSPTI